MQHKWHLLYCSCVGVGTIEDAQRPYASKYSTEYSVSDLRGGNSVCSPSTVHSFLAECKVIDANLATVKSDPAIEYLFPMPDSLDTPLADFLTDAQLQQIVDSMETRGYTATLDISLTFRDLNRSLIQESIFKSLLMGSPLPNDLDSIYSTRKIGFTIRLLRRRGVFVNPSVFKTGLTARKLIVALKVERKKNDTMRRLFKTHMDVPHVYRPGAAT